jgi:lysophospholipase L1-like esterase
MRKQMRQYVIVLAMVLGSLYAHAAPIKVACVGDSITRGPRNAHDASFPGQLARLLGDHYEVKNYGKPGIPLARYGETKEYSNAIAFNPDIVVILLGTNDAHEKNWKSRDFFKEKLKALLADFRKSNPKVTVYLGIPPPIFHSKWGHNSKQLAEEIVPAVKEAAAEETCQIIDFYALFLDKEDMLKDGVHPNNSGYQLMGEKIAAILKPE